MTQTCFYCIKGTREKTIKIRRSVFKCTMKQVTSAQEAKAFISRISKENKTATHNCWAYIAGDSGELSHCSDAGEPPGTAGKPMLNALQSHGMTNVASVVTRHFGGVKLGVRGLIQAYSESVESTIKVEPLIKLVKTVSYRLEVGYDFNKTLLTRLEPYVFRIVDTEYSHAVVHEIEIESRNKDYAQALLAEYQAQGQIEFFPL